MSRSWALVVSLAYLVILFGLTLGGFYHPNPPRNFLPFATMEHDIRKGGWEFLVNFVGNIVVTMPVGWILAFFLGRRCSAMKVALSSMALSGLIEVLQGFSRRRVADIDDVILNTIGGLIGYGLWVLGRRLTTWWRAKSDSAAENLPMEG